MDKEALRLIGVNIRTYGYFATYFVPDETDEGFLDIKALKDVDKFLQAVCDYYYNDSRINKDYGDDLSYQNETKRFLINKMKGNELSCENKGKEWLIENLIKPEYNLYFDTSNALRVRGKWSELDESLSEFMNSHPAVAEIVLESPEMYLL